MTAVGLAGLAALGAFWVYSALVLEWRGFGFGPRLTEPGRKHHGGAKAWLRQAGLEQVDPKEFVIVVGTLFVLGFTAALAVFGGTLPGLAVGGFAASFPVGSHRRRRRLRRERAQERWPAMIEEMRVQTTSLGRSIPQALFDVGRRSPHEVRPAFEAAHREWLLTTDFDRTVAMLKQRLADPSADMTLETLLVAHELGGGDLDRRLEALAADRRSEVESRKDARSRQAGARFARAFVLVVPAGMAFAGMSIGDGRDAYRSSAGQLTVLISIALVVGCWMWAGRVMRLPAHRRVFGR